MQTNQHIPKNNAAENRPAFITVLCILGFIGTALGIYYFGTMVYTGFLFYGLQDPSQGFSNFLILFTDIICVLSQFASLAGLILILKLKRTGFKIYMISECASLFFLIMTFAFAEGGAKHIGTYFYPGFILGLVIFFDLIFASMHSVNSKHLK